MNDNDVVLGTFVRVGAAGARGGVYLGLAIICGAVFIFKPILGIGPDNGARAGALIVGCGVCRGWYG